MTASKKMFVTTFYKPPTPQVYYMTSVMREWYGKLWQREEEGWTSGYSTGFERILLRLNGVVQKTPYLSFDTKWMTGSEEVATLESQLLIHASEMVCKDLYRLNKKGLTWGEINKYEGVCLGIGYLLLCWMHIGTPVIIIMSITGKETDIKSQGCTQSPM